MTKLLKHGITSSTPQNLMLGAGTIYKNLQYKTESKTWDGVILGATSGGNKFTITPTINDIEMDGAFVKVKGLRVKQGEEATMEVNAAETSPGIFKMALIGEDIKSSDADYVEGFDAIRTKSAIADEDYIDNIAFVGFRSDNKPVIIIMDNALCTSGLDAQGASGENTVYTLTFECHADISAGGDGEKNLDTLPVRVYYPSTSVAAG